LFGQNLIWDPFNQHALEIYMRHLKLTLYFPSEYSCKFEAIAFSVF